MSGHRLKPKAITDLEGFAADATAMHEAIIRRQMHLRVSQPHYRALSNLHEALVAAVCEITREKDPPWVRLALSGRIPPRQ